MNSNITTLALNLLISERINHRIVFAGKIIETLHQNMEGLENEKTTIDNFLTAISKCTNDPNCESRDLFFELARYYSQKINGENSLSAVA